MRDRVAPRSAASAAVVIDSVAFGSKPRTLRFSDSVVAAFVVVAQAEVQRQLARRRFQSSCTKTPWYHVSFSARAVEVDRCRRSGTRAGSVATSWKFCAAELSCWRVNAPPLLRRVLAGLPVEVRAELVVHAAGRSRRGSSDCPSAACRSAGTSRSCASCCRRGCRRCRGSCRSRRAGSTARRRTAPTTAGEKPSDAGSNTPSCCRTFGSRNRCQPRADVPQRVRALRPGVVVR